MMLPLNRYRFMDNETRVEVVLPKDDEAEDAESEEAKT
jgi:hypothetical protein